jgi:hypothetical protein
VRQKLNENPKAQAGLVLVLIAVAAFMLLGKSGGGSESEEAAPAEATVAVAGTSATGTAVASTAGEAVEGAVEGAIEAAGSEASAATVAASIPAPPMPAPVAAAYRANKTVVLLVVHDGGVDRSLVTASLAGLAGLPGVAVFVVPAAKISRYAAITLGTDVQQVPALLVMRPRRLSGGTPQASVAYGFQTPQSVVQAVRDASYKGPEGTYHPN